MADPAKPAIVGFYTDKQIRVAGYQFWIDPALIDRDPDQPRFEWGDADNDEAEVGKLAEGLRANGQLTDIKLREGREEWGEDPKRFVLVDGERRWRAAVDNKAPSVLASMVPHRRTKAEYFEMSTAMNFNRKGHTPLETARAFTRLREELGMSNEQIGARHGVSPSTVKNYLLVPKLPAEVLAMLSAPTPKAKRLRTHTVLDLLKLKSPADQIRIAQLAYEGRLRRYEVKELVKAAKKGKDDEGDTPPGRDPHPVEKFHVLRRLLGELGAKGKELLAGDFAKVLEVRTEDELKELLTRAADTTESLTKLVHALMLAVNKRGSGLEYEQAQQISDQLERAGDYCGKAMIGVFNQPVKEAKPRAKRKKVS